MNQILITPSQLSGFLKAPPSKSHTLRALYFALLAKGKTTIHNYLNGQDTYHMIKAIECMGAEVKIDHTTLVITSKGGVPSYCRNVIDAGNSGIIYRFMTALCSLMPNYGIITGDDSIRTHRPIYPLTSALNQLGCLTHFSNDLNHAPIIIKGPWKKNHAVIEGKDSQPVSALMYAGAFSSSSLTLQIKNLSEKPWIQLSLSWLERLNIPYSFDKDTFFLEGQQTINGFNYDVPGDFSSISYFLALSTLKRNTLSITDLDFTDMQGDKILIPLLETMGANISYSHDDTISITPSSLQGIEVDMDKCIDLLPTLAVIGCFANSKTLLKNAAGARLKECDRLTITAQELSKMGAQIEITEDSMTIYPSKLKGAELSSHFDHRMAMALTIAALCAEGPSTLEGIECVNKTYPHFFEEIKRLGGCIEHCSCRI